jgi:type VI secretion system protein ImpJ
MQNHQVHWSEGMFLRPHHFQASDRFWSEVNSQNFRFDHPYGYGVSAIKISGDALSNGLILMQGLNARFHDGTIVSNSDGQKDQLDIKSRLSPKQLGQTLTVYLATPGLSEGLANVDADANSKSRFVATSVELPDENAGASRQEIGLRHLNYRIMLSSEDLAGFDLLPIMRVKSSSSLPGSYILDEDYIPPILSIAAWSELETMIRDLQGFLGAKIRTLNETVRDQNITLATQAQGDLEKLWLLQVVNQSYSELRCITSAAGLHPLPVYLQLCSIAGRCAIFGQGFSLDDVPAYDHDDLGTIFKRVIDIIRRLINSVKEDEVHKRYFIGSGPGMHVNLDPEWLGPEWDWFFGVCPLGFGLNDCAQLFRLTSGNRLDIKLGASDKVEEYMTKMQPGLRYRGMSGPPRELANQGKWLFFQIDLEGDPWRYVQESQSLGLRVNKRQILNLDTLEGSRRLNLALDGRSYGLEFAVFAVKRKK